MNVIDGKEIRDSFIESIKVDNHNRKLKIILVGDRKDSEQYVNNKIKFCKKAGIETELVRIKESSENKMDMKKEIIESIPQFDEWCILQMPIPGLSKEEEEQLVNLIPIKNDLDMLSSKAKSLFYKSKTINEAMKYAPLTPFGIMNLFNEKKINLEGKKIMVIGRSEIVGRPIAHLVGLANATVFICNSKTSEDSLKEIMNISDIVISATGIPNFINKDNFSSIDVSKKIIIDVGINFLNGKFVGDICEMFKSDSMMYTPVPGGIGPLTIKSVVERILK